VKHGSTEAEIEIELAASGNQRNPVVRRRIQKEGNKTMFYVNNVYKSQKDVKALAESFSIQINNLCQFLPQDRVVEFAKMDPIAMLGETLRAASSGQMVEWHEELKRLRTDEKAAEREQQNEQHHLKTLQAKQSSTREDVDRYNQRQGLVNKSKALGICRPFIRVREIKAERKQIQEDLRTGRIELSRYESEADPVRRAEAEMENDKARIERISASRKHVFQVKKGTVGMIANRIDSGQQHLSNLAADIDTEKQNEKKRRQDVRRLENEISNLQQQLEGNAVEYDPDSFNSRVAVIRARKSAASQKQSKIIHDMNSIRNDAVRIKNTIRSKKEEKAHLNSRSGQRDSILSNLSPDTYKGWTWLKANIDTLSLKDKVYGPPVIECSVPDPKYADAVEALLRHGDLTAITCTNKEDAQKVQNKLVGKKDDGGLGLHHITIRTVPLSRSSYPSPLTPEELASFGFDGWISNYIEGPDAVLAMLCDSAKLHATAFSARAMTDDQYSKLERNERLQKCVAGSQVYTVTRRREYGISSTSTSTIKKAKHFTGQPVATIEIGLVEDAIKDLERDATTLKERHEAIQEEYNAAKHDAEEAEAEKVIYIRRLMFG
jgi:chromosome segregation ATPase